MRYLKTGTSAVYGAIVLFFFLPFVTVTCNDQHLATLKGAELATGYVIGSHASDSLDAFINTQSLPDDETGENPHRDIDRNNFATVAWLLGIAGLVLSFLMLKYREVLVSVTGLAGGLCLILMRMQLDNSARDTRASEDKIINTQVRYEYEVGYWLVLIFFLLAGAVNIYQYMEQKKKDRDLSTSRLE